MVPGFNPLLNEKSTLCKKLSCLFLTQGHLINDDVSFKLTEERLAFLTSKVIETGNNISLRLRSNN